MGSSYLIDTNVLIYYFNDQIPAQAIPLMDEIVSQSFNVSIVTKIEFLGWAGYTASQYQEALKILGMATVFPLDEQVADQAVILRRQKKIKLGDAVIAGTCLQHGLTLVTRNMVDFAGISELPLYNPFA
jgi:toxin FitB